MSNSMAVNDTLPPNVPALDISGSNWAMFELRFRMVVRGKGLWGHFDGTTPRPALPTPTPAPTPAPPSTPAAPTESAVQAALPPSPPPVTIDDIELWDRNESISQALLAQRIPDSTFVVVASYPTVQQMWKAVVNEYTYKSDYSQANLHQEFMASRCPPGGDVRVFLTNLRAKKSELLAVGVHISDNEYRSAIIQSLPRWLATFASNQLSAARLHSSLGKTIDPDLLIIMICDEWDRTCRFSKKTAKPEGDDALGVEAENKGKSKAKEKSKGKEKKKGPCWICGGEHLKKDCPKRKDKKEEGSKKDQSTSANVTTEGGDDDESFAVDVEEVGKASQSTARIKIFDSGSSRHISPCRDVFTLFTSTSPCML